MTRAFSPDGNPNLSGARSGVAEPRISGIHHVTAIASDPQRNLDFYGGLLGLRFVKRTVNFDDPGSYHFYFGDTLGKPGTLMTFFPWPGAPRGRVGAGQVTATAFAVPSGSIDWWRRRFESHGVDVDSQARFGNQILAFEDPDGLNLELVGIDSTPKGIEPWRDGSVAAEHGIAGFHGVTLAPAGPADRSFELLEKVLGFARRGVEGARTRLEASGPAPGTIADVVVDSGMAPGRLGAGVVHHVAWRTADSETQRAWMDRLFAASQPTTDVAERCYFRSIYFREPGHVLHEIATEGPGMAIDEDAGDLGSTLRLPPWLESSRARIEAALPRIEAPKPSGTASRGA